LGLNLEANSFFVIKSGQLSCSQFCALCAVLLEDEPGGLLAIALKER